MISLFPIRKYHFRYFAAQSGLTWILVFSGESPNPLPFTLIAGSGAAGKANVLLLFGVKLFVWLDRVGFLLVEKSGKLLKFTGEAWLFVEWLPAGKNLPFPIPVILFPIISSILDLESLESECLVVELELESRPNLAGETILNVVGWWWPYNRVNFVVVGEKFRAPLVL